MNATGQVEPSGSDPALVLALITEHSTLQSARAATVIEANGRAMLPTRSCRWVGQVSSGQPGTGHVVRVGDDGVAPAERTQHQTAQDLDWKTPAEAFNEHLLLLQQAGVASTG